MTEQICIGIDVGGTFTDAVLTGGSRAVRAKVPTAPDDLGTSVLAALALLAERSGTSVRELLPRVRRFGLGTTAVTNLLAARTGAAVGLITTAGFEDELPVAKGRRVSDGLWSVYPEPVVPRHRILGVRERIDRDGVVVVPLDAADAVGAARHLVEREGATSLAVSFLWSFRNPRHEELAVAAISETLPDVPVVSGSALQPTIREFERTAFAVLNAYAVEALPGIDGLAGELARQGLSVPMLLVHSGGGSVTTSEARAVPLGLAASGPAAGVAASVPVATAAKAAEVVTCDMGGTSFDVAVVSGGRVPRRGRSEIAGLLTSLPMVDVESIGAGGSSIGWVDARGMLRVGPQSAGATPGPAGYGRGGTDATVTDALLVLGYLDAGRFLGGEMSLDVDAARRACAALGERVGMDAEECAWGIHRLALDGMTTAVRRVLTSRGLRPPDHAVVSYGGCAALFTADLAGSLGMQRILVPELSSVLSAFGAASADVRRERARSVTMALPAESDVLEKIGDELRDAVDGDLDADGIAPEDRRVVFEADLRFMRQVWELTIPVPSSTLDAAALDRLLEDFRAEYTTRYGAGSMMLGAPVELLTLRAIGIGRTTQAQMVSGRRRGVTRGTPAPPDGDRRVRVARGGRGWRRVPVYAGESLRPGHVIDGPALVDERDTTVWIPPGARATVERAGTLVIELAGRQHGRPRSRQRRTVDPIELELLRSQLEAVAEDAASTIERTAISPVVTETKDYSATLLDADGRLVAGGGVITYHWVAATRAIRSTMERHAGDIGPGDVFLANDPYNGGGLHPNDVFVQRPIFAGERLVAWVALSAHLIDMGGMAMGSFAPAATDCYQEALRIPPVRLLRAGVEVSDVWDIFRTNVRLAPLVEMDLRGLVAGANIAQEKVAALASRRGADELVAGMRALQELSERELRARIRELADGTYRSTTWVEWDDELFELPCTLTVAEDELHFDFTGSSPQAAHFFNSKPYIIKSGFLMQAAWLFVPDLPYTEGLLEPIDLLCPEGTIVNSVPPAPINAGHIHVAFAAAEVMTQCLRLAMWASPGVAERCPVHGLGGYSALALSTWSGLGLHGMPDTWMFTDGTRVGASAGADRDGPDMGSSPIAAPQPAQVPDVEILESWYPMLVGERRLRPGVGGAGRHRSGAGCLVTLSPHGTGRLIGQMVAMRAVHPLEGAAGGLPGASTELWAVRAGGAREVISTAAAGVVLDEGDYFEIRCATGGGVGDPVDRDPNAVAADLRDGRLTRDEVSVVYGVALDDAGGVDRRSTSRKRSSMLRARLRRATAPRRAVADDIVTTGDDVPLYPGVVQRGSVAVAADSGAPLALAGDHWTDGCPILEERRKTPGTVIVERAYLDPRTGRFLYVEAVPEGADRSFAVEPARFTRAGAS